MTDKPALQVRAEGYLAEASAYLNVVTNDDFVVDSKEKFAEVGQILKEVKDKAKFWEQERKVSAQPHYDEFARINAWFKPATDKLKKLIDHCERLMSRYILEKKREEDRLLREAQAAAREVLATEPSPEAVILDVAGKKAKQAAAAAPPKVDGLSHKTVWRFRIVNPDALVRAHPDLAMPDEKKISAWVAKHGNEHVPAGVVVEEDVDFRRTRSSK